MSSIISNVEPSIVLHVTFVRKSVSIMHDRAREFLTQTELLDMYCCMPFADDDAFMRDT